MNTTIEQNLTLGLVRIFTAYGWNGKGAPKNWKDKLDIIRYGLYHGEALDYATHLSLLIAARKKDKQWGIYTPEFVQGISYLLRDYINHNDLQEINPPKVKEKFESQVSSVNVFISHSAALIKDLW